MALLLAVSVGVFTIFNIADGKCPYIVTIHNGTVSYTNQHIRNDIGGKVRFKCYDGWQLLGKESATCLATSKWSNDPPTCKLARCPVLRGLDNGRTVMYKNVVGGHAEFRCDPGHRLLGRQRITCMENQRWSNIVPKCLPAICPSIRQIRNGRLIGRFRNDVGGVVHFHCDKGYTIRGHAKLKCLESLHWDHPVPTCECVDAYREMCEYDKMDKCPFIVSIPHGSASQTGVTVNSWVTLSCDHRFRLRGKKRLKCKKGGRFSGEIPDCVAHTCPHYEHFNNGLILGQTTVLVNSFMKVKCNPGYAPRRQMYIKCQDKSLKWWAHTNCEEYKCPDILYFENGYVENYINEIDKSFQWKCDSGYVLRKSKSRHRKASAVNRCNGNQRWNNADVICIPNSS